MEIVLTAFLMILILFLIHGFYVRQLRKKDDQINAFKESLTDLQAKLKDKERRRAFRIKLLDQECTFELIDFGDKLLEPLKHRKGEGKIKNISRTGMKLRCEFDLPVKKQIFLQLHFVLHDEEFSFKGKIVRKEELMNDIFYGIDFIEVNPKEQQRLLWVIQKIEIERRKETEYQ
ncbi:PilZ domain-containing protein [Aneurinibacillus terranovensis]|uniref:PilZ domain-containing protein n=1 Tax=Aneurinibacillus terranovensis TaxID=278991 RepID=UPI000428C6B2|nr:PilZ domain-containing protein [Aneurinibacillus terranovensis]